MGSSIALSPQEGGLPARSVLSASIDLSAAIDRRAGLLSAAPELPRKPAMDAATASVIYNEHFSGLQVMLIICRWSSHPIIHCHMMVVLRCIGHDRA